MRRLLAVFFSLTAALMIAGCAADDGQPPHVVKTDEHSYKYKVEVSGRMPNAAKDAKFVLLTNAEETITFEQVMNSQIGSSADPFDKAETVIVAWK